jgi:hypothetical protein
MISLVQALSFRAIRYTRQPLDRFQILVGPNASGKSTFLGIIDLIGKLADWRDDITEPMARLSPNFRDLTFMRAGGRFEIAIEAKIPDHLRRLNDKGERNGPEFVRYEISLGEAEPGGAVGVIAENLWLRPIGGEEPPPSSARDVSISTGCAQ